MADLPRLGSAVVLVVGVLLVFGGLSAALGFTPLGIVASIGAIVSLLYAGAVWFGQPRPGPIPQPPPAVVVFDRERRIVTGPAAGQPLAMQFAEILRPEIERRCNGALAGTAAQFVCLQNGSLVVFDALPVRTAEGAIVYGILLTAGSAPAAVAASA